MTSFNLINQAMTNVSVSVEIGVSSTSRFFETAPKGSFSRYLLSSNQDCLIPEDRSVDLLKTISQDYPESGSLQTRSLVDDHKIKHLTLNNCSYSSIDKKRTSNQFKSVLGTYSYLKSKLPSVVVDMIFQFSHNYSATKWYIDLVLGHRYRVPRHWIDNDVYVSVELVIWNRGSVLDELCERVPKLDEFGLNTNHIVFALDDSFSYSSISSSDFSDYEFLYDNIGYDMEYPFSYTAPKQYSNYNEMNYYSSDIVDVSHLPLQSENALINCFPRIDKSWYFVGLDSKIKFIEDVLCWWYSMSRSRNVTDVVMAYTVFCKSQLSCALTTKALFSFDSTVQLIEKYFTKVTFTPEPAGNPQRNIDVNALRRAMGHYNTKVNFDSWNVPLQGLTDNLESLKRNMLMVNTIRNSKVLRKMKDLIINILASNVFSKCGFDLNCTNYTKLEKDAISARRWKGTDFVVNVIESFIFITERIHAAYSNNDCMELFFTGSQYDNVLKDLREIKFYQQCLYNRVDDTKYNGTTLLCKIDTLLSQIQSYLKYFDSVKAGVDRKYLLSVMSELTQIRDEYVSLDYKLGTRKAPLGILVFGDSGIGKSTFLEVLFMHFALRRKLDTSSKCKYFKNPVSKYWDNFKTFMWCVILDDIGFLKPSIAQAGGDKTVMEVINVMNNISYIPDQAALHDKGQHPLKAELVIGTTNTKDLNAFNYFSCPSAAQRRFPYIINTYVKDMYANEDGMLDNTKIPLNTTSYPDYWYFVIEKVIPQTVHTSFKTLATTIEIGRFDDMKSFIVWYNNVIDEHYAKQSQAATSLDNLHTVTLCECNMPQSMCMCELPLQSDKGYVAQVRDYVYDSYMTLLLFMLSLCIWLMPRATLGYFIKKYMFYTNAQFKLIQSKYDYYHAKYCKQTKKMLVPNTYLMGFLAVLSTCLVAYKLFVSFFRESDAGYDCKFQADSNDGVVPQPRKNEKSNMWYVDDYITSPCDFGNLTIGNSKLDRESLIRSIAPNLVYAQFNCDGFEPLKARGTCVYSDVYMFNNHLILSDVGTVFLINTLQKEGVNSNISVNFSQCDVMRFKEKDLCFIRLRGAIPRKDITTYFMKAYAPLKNDGFYVNRARDGQLNVLNVEAIKQKRLLHKDISSDPVDAWSGIVKVGTRNGDCGSVLISQTPMGYVFLGIHVVGHETSCNIFALNVDQTIINDVKSTFDCVVVQGPANISVPSRQVELLPLHHKSEVRFVEHGSAEVYGSLSIPRNNSKSTVEDTIMAPYLKEYGYETKFTKPDLKSWRPWHLAFKEMVEPATNFDNSILDDCIMAFKDDILVAGIDLSELEVYSDFTAVNGAQGVAYVDKMNRATSMGYPYNKSKKFFLHSIEAQYGLQDPVDFSEEVWDQVREIEAKLRKGIRCNPIFNANLKDEAVSHEKAEDGKTRVFAGMPVAYAIVMRKYTLSMVRLIQNNQFLFECACGISCQSLEWEALNNHLALYNLLQAIAGDFRKYDKKMSAKAILCGFQLIHDLCALSGNYNKEDLMVIKTIAYDIAFNWQNFNGTLIQFFGSNPSGHVLTVIINSICNSMYMRYAFVKATGLEAKLFKQYVRLMTYGDDNIMTVNDASIGFNHTSIQRVMAECGIDYTMADKESESKPFIHLNETTFLKRSFRYDEDLGHIVAPLEHDSIEKMLMVWNKSKSICAKAQAVAVIASANMEYFWYGADIFKEKQLMFSKLISALELQNYCDDNTLASYETLKSRFLGSETKQTSL